MASKADNLVGVKVLIVEDDLLLAEAAADSLGNWGCEVIGMAPSVAAGLNLARESDLDGALLDINLRGDRCFPVAKALKDRNVPFIFTTGYDDREIIPVEFRSVRCLSKPVDSAALFSEMMACFRRRSDD